MVQWLRLHNPNAGGPGLIPGQRTRFHTLQLKIPGTIKKKIFLMFFKALINSWFIFCKLS